MSRGLSAVAVTVWDPGTPGTARSDRLTTQVTSAVMVAGVPAGEANPLVSTDTEEETQSRPCSASERVAAASAVELASGCVRAIEASRAAWLAADWPWRRVDRHGR